MHSPEIGQESRGREATDVDVLIQGFSNYLQALKKSPRTVEEYTKDVTRWARWWQRPVEFFDQEEWDDWVISLAQSGVSGKSINRYRAALKRFYRYLRRRKLVTHDPSYDSESAGTEKHLPVILTQAEVPLVRRRLKSPKTRALFALLYDCGLRSEEARTMTVGQVSEESVHVHGKGAKDRIVPITPETSGILTEWITCMDGANTCMFATAGGGIMDEPAVYKLVRRVVQGAGIQKHITPHSLRHSIATHLVENGMSIEKVQAFLGHESIETTRIYVKLAQKQVKDAVLAAHPNRIMSVIQ